MRPVIPTEDLPGGDRYPWVAMGVVLVGTFMVILDTTIVNVALPQIGIALHSRTGIEWVVTAYLLAVGIGLPATGYLADRFGRKQIFIVSLSLFTLGSLLAAASPNLPVLVGFRVLQGLGGGAMIPVGMAMVYELFPPDRRGTALGVWGVAAMAGPAFGPVIGGYLVTAVSWHWLFLVNVPLGVLGAVLAVRLLRDTGFREHRPFDTLGLVLAACGLGVWLFAFSRASDWGWGSAPIIVMIGAGAVALYAFGRRELRLEHPLIELRIFTVPVFSLTIAIGWMIVVMQYGRLVFLPLELETIRGMTAFRVGLLFTPAAAAAAATFALGGRLTDRIGPKLPVTVGAACIAVAAWMLGHLSTDTSIAFVLTAMVIQGLGTGLSTMPASVTGMNALPSRFVAQASAVRTLNRRVAASFGVAVLSTIVAMRLGAVSAAGISGPQLGTAQAAYNTVFLIAFYCALVAIVLAQFLPNREQNHLLHEARAAERAEDELTADAH